MKNYILLVFISLCAITGFSQEKKEIHPRENYTGFFNFSYEEKTDKIFLEVDKLNTDFLYVYSLASGIGSNDIGLDRGQIGDGVVVQFQKMGNKLMLVQPNLRYRANTSNSLERKSVEQAFAKSVLFGFPIISDKDYKYTIDLTPFLLQDAHGVIQSLADDKQGVYKLDVTKSALSLPRTKAFPENVEFEALLTFAGKPTGKNIKSVTPNAALVSVTQHHSFVKLPDANYKPRVFDPRSGAINISYYDYATPIQEPMLKRFITRHRLEKKNPNATKSEAKEPIIYYLDPGTPEPVRSALLDGARWWNEAYEEIGYTNAFQVRMLPEDADPMDVRYNVIQWVHRSTRGWSYGMSIIDPRTGEIMKRHVSLGSLRIRQDFMIAQALSNKPFAERMDNHDQMLEMALARIRQLSAHEVGHTLGFAHNFAASSNNRQSVMDYPHPTLTLQNGEVNFDNAYATGIGDWDKVAADYSYSDIPSSVNEPLYLSAILNDARAKGMQFISDSDARAQGGAHPTAHLWDNGVEASQELLDLLSLRKVAIGKFTEDNIRMNEPYSVLEDVFVPLYFYHRFQTEAAVKVIGGINYEYTTRFGEGGSAQNIVPKKAQEKALKAVLKTLEAQTLAIPREQLDLFPPRAYGYDRTRESFKSNMGVAFDALGAPATASKMTLQLLLHPERANRLVQQKALEAKNLGLEEVLNELTDLVYGSAKGSDYEKEVHRTIQFVTLQQLMNLIATSKAIPQTKAIAKQSLQNISAQLSKGSRSTFEQFLLDEINKFNRAPEKFKVMRTPKIPDGSPIGSDDCSFSE